jgi:hypothetical protein
MLMILERHGQIKHLDYHLIFYSSFDLLALYDT